LTSVPARYVGVTGQGELLAVAAENDGRAEEVPGEGLDGQPVGHSRHEPPGAPAGGGGRQHPRRP